MSRPLRVLCRPALAPGFALAGLSATTADPATMLADLATRSDPSVVLVEEGLAAALPGELRRRLERRGVPLLVPFPGPAAARRGSAEALLVEILRRAVGYRVRLR